MGVRLGDALTIADPELESELEAVAEGVVSEERDEDGVAEEVGLEDCPGDAELEREPELDSVDDLLALDVLDELGEALPTGVRLLDPVALLDKRAEDDGDPVLVSENVAVTVDRAEADAVRDEELVCEPDRKPVSVIEAVAEVL